MSVSIVDNDNVFYISHLWALECMAGPFRKGDTSLSPTTKLRSNLAVNSSDLRQGLGIAGENSVFHNKLDMDAVINPALTKPSNAEVALTTNWQTEYYRRNFRNSDGRIYSGVVAPTHNSASSYGVEYRPGAYAWFEKPAPNVVIHSRIGPYRTSDKSRDGFATINIVVDEGSRARVYHARKEFYGKIDEDDSNAVISLVHQLADSVKRIDRSTMQSYTAEKYSGIEGSFDMDAVKNEIESINLFDASLLTNQVALQSYGDLCHHAAGNIDANSANMIAFVRDLKDIKSLIPKLKNLMSLKTHADNYLAVNYGVLPTISDLKAIVDAFEKSVFRDKNGLKRVSAYDTGSQELSIKGKRVICRVDRRLHLAINDRDTGLDALTERWRSTGFFPSLTNIWDLVPYSFVLDWFIDVGSVFERIDTKHRLLNLDIPYCIRSEKTSYSYEFTNSDLGLQVNVTHSAYIRDVSTSVPQPRIFADLVNGPTVQNHWIEGSALLLQRKN